MDAYKGLPNVIHSIGEEFTGPLSFVQFWLDVIAEWEQENGKVLVDLAVNKDVQDAILKDPMRSKIVDIIDIEQWFYHNKGEYAPPGGVNMAQRQYMRKIRTGGARFEDVSCSQRISHAVSRQGCYLFRPKASGDVLGFLDGGRVVCGHSCQ